MLLNHEGLTVHDADAQGGKPASLCPQCQRPLLAKRGQFKIWHWAHKAHNDPPCNHTAGETQWHLCWKAAFVKMGWRVERPYEVANADGSKSRFVFDAALERDGMVAQAYEFVHSLSEGYAPKGRAVVASGVKLTWVFDGGSLSTSQRKLYVHGKGPDKILWYSRLLKDKAFAVSQSLAGAVLVHQGGGLWRHRVKNLWDPIGRPEGTDPADLARQFELLKPEQLRTAFRR